jgi:serine/threonine protein phosphatase PrpC
MNCIFCNEPMDPQFSFCEACGKPLASAAPVLEVSVADSAIAKRCVCGSTSFDVEGYCDACGHRMSPQDAIEVLEIGARAASASHRGRHHPDNQDAVLMLELSNGIAIAVADGVSTSCHAREAADIAVKTALQVVQDYADLPPQERIKLAVQRAHMAVCSLPYDNTQLAEPQATLVMVLVEGSQLCYAWVGDSRLYVIEDTKSTQLTIDDSWLNGQLRAGVPIAAAQKDVNAHCITQCLGMLDDELDIHVDTLTLAANASLLLCSDGLWNYCEEPEKLHNLLASGDGTESLAQLCVRLVDFANSVGGQDNITVAAYDRSK